MIIFCLNYFLSNNLVWKLPPLNYIQIVRVERHYLTAKLQIIVVSTYKDIFVGPINYDALLAEGKFDKNVLA